MLYHESDYTGVKFKSIKRQQNAKTQQKKIYSGGMTKGTKKRIERAVSLMVQGVKSKKIYNPITKKIFNHQLSFITLTISSKYENLEADYCYKKLLGPFLQWLRRIKNCNTYLWKLELQKRGMIHYHITTPAFIPWQEIRDKWNNLQRKEGLMQKFFEEFGHWNANSTDIKEVRNIANIEAYLIKYLSKTEQNEVKVKGKIWDCSANLKGAKYFKINPSYLLEKKLIWMAENKKCVEFIGERFALYKFNSSAAHICLSPDQFREYRRYLNAIINPV